LFTNLMQPKRKRMPLIFYRGYFFFTGFALSLFMSGLLLFFQGKTVAETTSAPLSSPTEQPAQPTLPTVQYEDSLFPDWQNITLSSFPPLESSGEFDPQQQPNNVPPDFQSVKTWDKGDKPVKVLSLGDFTDSFKLQEFTMDDISQITGLDVDSVTLDKFQPVGFQDVKSLVEAIPSLLAFPVVQVPPLKDLFLQNVGPVGFDPTKTVGQLLVQSPQLGQLKMADLPLDKYTMKDLPNAKLSPLGSFKDWSFASVEGVPSLDAVPFSDFPQPPLGPDTAPSASGIVDVAFGAAESDRTQTISGSNVEGYNVPCDKGCAHIELSGSSSVLGKQWISGKYQLVKGGQGVLGKLNGGKEPTGRNPFGDAFKVVIWDVSEPHGMATESLFFRFCRRGMPDLGCTPYFLGPIPFMTLKEKAPIYLGEIDSSGGGSASSTPTQIAEQEREQAQQQLKSPISPSSQSGSFSPNSKKSASSSPASSFTAPSTTSSSLSTILPPAPNCNKQSGGVVLDAMSEALSQIEGNYDSVGSYVCDSSKNCGRALGAHQYMSYRDDVRQVIQSKKGGADFLKLLDSGAPITGEQSMQYFSPVDQQSLFDQDAQALISKASSEVDPTTGSPFAGDRLLERVAQMHFGGQGVPVDSTATDVFGKYSVKSYGKAAADNYKNVVAGMGCN
jgi:hypothetical protein